MEGPIVTHGHSKSLLKKFLKRGGRRPAAFLGNGINRLRRVPQQGLYRIETLLQDGVVDGLVLKSLEAEVQQGVGHLEMLRDILHANALDGVLFNVGEGLLDEHSGFGQGKRRFPMDDLANPDGIDVAALLIAKAPVRQHAIEKFGGQPSFADEVRLDG